MLEIKVTVNAKELADAVNALAVALSGNQMPVVITEKPVQPAETIQAPVMREEAQKPVEQPTAPQKPVEQPTAPQKPAEVAQSVAEVPQTKALTLDEVARAGAALLDMGKMAEVMAVMKQFGVQALTQLKPETYQGVAEEFRKLGAAI